MCVPMNLNVFGVLQVAIYDINVCIVRLKNCHLFASLPRLLKYGICPERISMVLLIKFLA
jgi:hypothetical protein